MDWSSGGFSGTIEAMNVVVCVKQIPDPAAPQALDPPDPHPGQGGQADHGRLRCLRRRDGPAARRSGRRRGGHPGLDGTRRGDLGPAHRPRHGRGQGHPRERRRPQGIRCPVDGQGPRQGHRAGPARPGHRRHRVDRRLHRDDAGAGGRAPRLPVGDLRQEGLGRRRPRARRAPDRGRLRRGRLPAARRRDRHRGRRRAALPVVQGDHGGQVEAGGPADGGRPRPRRRPGRRRRARARRSPT